MSGADQAGPGGSNTFRAGSELREARERLGWDLGEVAAALRIKLAYLQAIEDGRVSALPGNAYALGFLRTYATTLGLDPDAVARRFRAEAQDVNRPTELAFPAPVPERGVPIGALVLLGLAIAVVAYGGWYRLTDHEQAATHTVPPVPEQLLAAPKAAPVSPQVASVMPPAGAALPTVPAPAASAAPSSAIPVPAQVPVTPNPQATTPATSPTQMVPPTTSAPTTSAPTTPTPSVPAPPAQTAPPAAQPGLVLHATAATWVQIHAPTGHVIWDHVMQPGETWPVPAGEPGLTLTTGNAGGLEISDNGANLGNFGRVGAIRRNIALTEDGVKQALAPASAATNGPIPATTPPPVIHHAPRPPATSDDSADQLNAQQLDRSPPAH